MYAEVVPNTTKATLQAFLADTAQESSQVFTDEHVSYMGLRNHKAVSHSLGQWVVGMAHTTGLESFWSIGKGAYQGTYHHHSKKHLNRYVAQIAAKHIIREMDTLAQILNCAACLLGCRIMYKDLVAAHE